MQHASPQPSQDPSKCGRPPVDAILAGTGAISTVPKWRDMPAFESRAPTAAVKIGGSLNWEDGRSTGKVFSGLRRMSEDSGPPMLEHVPAATSGFRTRLVHDRLRVSEQVPCRKARLR
eukprot:scaffold5365_cov115-Isochrysis_galbana.AAC.11